MRKLFIVWALALVAFLAPVAFAQMVGPIDPSAPLTDSDLQELLKSLGGVHGAGVLGTTAVVIQFLMYLMRSQVGKIAGKWQLATVAGLSFAGTVVGLRLIGVSWVGCLLHSYTLASGQVFAHQLMIKFGGDENNRIQS